MYSYGQDVVFPEEFTVEKIQNESSRSKATEVKIPRISEVDFQRALQPICPATSQLHPDEIQNQRFSGQIVQFCFLLYE